MRISELKLGGGGEEKRPFPVKYQNFGNATRLQ